MLAPKSGVSHLDLSNRLIAEQAWPTKRPGDGNHPDTPWSRDGTSQTAPRSRVAVMAQTLQAHSMNLPTSQARCVAWTVGAQVGRRGGEDSASIQVPLFGLALPCLVWLDVVVDCLDLSSLDVALHRSPLQWSSHLRFSCLFPSPIMFSSTLCLRRYT